MRKETLSKNQKIILDYIEKVNEPIKAYSILHNVQKKGIKAPPQVYRALDKFCHLNPSPSPRDLSTWTLPSSG